MDLVKEMKEVKDLLISVTKKNISQTYGIKYLIGGDTSGQACVKTNIKSTIFCETKV